MPHLSPIVGPMRRSPVLLPSLLAVLALTLGGCSGGDDPAGEPDRTAGGATYGDGVSVVEAGTDAGLDCADDALPLARTMSSGATWSLCFGTEAKRGMVLRQVTLTPPDADPFLVADEIAIAQLEVPYDTGDRITSDITSYGFGGIKLQDLTPVECPGERIEIAVPNIGDGKFGETPVRTVLCSEHTDGGLAYRSEESGDVAVARQDRWTLATISKVGWYEYLTRYTFGSDGSITPELGATGDLSPADYTKDHAHGAPVGVDPGELAASHAHNAVWRIDWALGGGELAVEQYDATPTGRTGTKAPVVDGGLTPVTRPGTARAASGRWWRVLAPGTANADGHPVSYEIDLRGTDSFTFAPDLEEHGRGAGYDVAFTQADDCQLYATGNDGPCGDGVLDYLLRAPDAGLTDVVSWVAVGFHHVPRDEDQSPMQLHWQGFAVTPRDLTATRFDPAPGREGYNGRPETWNGERVEDLEGSELP